MITLIRLLTFVAILAGALAGRFALGGRRQGLAHRLAALTPHPPDPKRPGLPRTPAAARRAGRFPFPLSYVGRRAARAGVETDPATVTLIAAGSAITLAACGLALTGSWWLAALASLGGLYAPLAMIERAGRRRTERVSSQLDRLCVQLATAMEAGASAYQAMSDTAPLVGQPVEAELRRVLQGVKQGLPLREAIGILPERVPLAEVRLLAAAVRLHLDAGADLPVVLKDIVRTLHARQEAAAATQAATASGRTQALILALLPLAFLMVFRVLYPGYLDPLFHTAAGQLTLGAAAVWTVLGYMVTRRIVAGALEP